MQKREINGLAPGYVFGGLIVLVGLGLFAWTGLRPLLHNYQTSHWVPVTTDSIDSKVVAEQRGSRDDKYILYAAEVSYTYRYDNKAYREGPVRYAGDRDRSKAENEVASMKAYPHVWVNPRNPSESAPFRYVYAPLGLSLCLGSIFAAVGMAAIAAQATAKRRAREQATDSAETREFPVRIPSLASRFLYAALLNMPLLFALALSSQALHWSLPAQAGIWLGVNVFFQIYLSRYRRMRRGLFGDSIRFTSIPADHAPVECIFTMDSQHEGHRDIKACIKVQIRERTGRGINSRTIGVYPMTCASRGHGEYVCRIKQLGAGDPAAKVRGVPQGEAEAAMQKYARMILMAKDPASQEESKAIQAAREALQGPAVETRLVLRSGFCRATVLLPRSFWNA
jgi:hypothetical protein